MDVQFTRRAVVAAGAGTVAGLAGCLGTAGLAPDAPPIDIQPGASVRFDQPTPGAVARAGVSLAMAAENVAVAPAGEAVDGEGHFHVIVDGDPVTPGEEIPDDPAAGYYHFDAGERVGLLDLPPGDHRLVLQFGDGLHRATRLVDEVRVRVRDDAYVWFMPPVDGARVRSPFRASLGADGVTIEPAGPIYQSSGHFHVLVDVDPVAPGALIPADDRHLHFGDGATRADLDLPPGERRLVLQVGNGAHLATPLYETITVTVLGDEQ
jgi:hypothetical protein